MPSIEELVGQRLGAAIYDILSKYAKTCHGIDSLILHIL